MLPTPRSLVYGGLWSVTAKIIPQLYLVIISIAAARLLGPEQLGRQSFIAFTQIALVVLATAGLPVAIMRSVSENRGRGHDGVVRDLIRWAWRIELAAAVVACAALLCVASYSAESRAAWALAAVVAPAAVLHTVPSALLIGMQRWREASIAGLGIGAVATAATLLMLASGGGVASMFAVQAVAAIAGLLWTQRLARRALTQLAPDMEMEVPVDSHREILRYAGIASANVILGFVVWRRSELFFLARYAGDVDIALYSVAFAAVTALARLFDAFAAILTPAVATLVGAGAHRTAQAGSRRAFRFALLASVPLTALSIVLGPSTLTLTYGEQLAGSGTVLMMLLPTFPIVCLSTIGAALLHGFGHQRVLVASGVAGATANIVLAMTFIPSLGAPGAALANCGAQLVYSLPILVYASRELDGLHIGARRLATLAAVSVASAAAAWLAVTVAAGVLGVIAGWAIGTSLTLFLIKRWHAAADDDVAWLHAAARSALRQDRGLVLEPPHATDESAKVLISPQRVSPL